MESEPVLNPLIVFSDTVIREHGSGKLSLIGTFQQFVAPRFPFTSPAFYTTVSITNLTGDPEKVKIAVRIEDGSSGHVLCSTGADVLGEKPFERHFSIEIPFPMGRVVFQSAGTYQVVVLVNSEIIGKRNIIVVPVTQSQNPAS